MDLLMCCFYLLDFVTVLTAELMVVMNCCDKSHFYSLLTRILIISVMTTELMRVFLNQGYDKSSIILFLKRLIPLIILNLLLIK